MSDAARSLSSKLHALWDNLDAEERRLLAMAAAGDDSEVDGFAGPLTLAQLLPPLAGFMDYTDDSCMDHVRATPPKRAGTAR